MAGERALPGLGIMGYYTIPSDGWGNLVSDDFRVMSALLGARVKSRTAALPGTPTLGDIYIAPAGHAEEDKLAIWDGPSGSEVWNYVDPQEGWTLYVLDEMKNYQYAGGAFPAGAWSELATAGGGGGGGASFANRFMHCRDEKAAGVNGGTSLDDTWNPRDLNVVKFNNINGASLNVGNGEVSLPAGEYFIMGNGPANQNNQHKTRWRNLDDATTDLDGQNEFVATPSDNNTTRSWFVGRLTLAAGKRFRIEHWTNDNIVNTGLGVSFGALHGLPEVYSEVFIWQLGEATPTGGTVDATPLDLWEQVLPVASALTIEATVQGRKSTGEIYSARILNSVRNDGGVITAGTQDRQEIEVGTVTVGVDASLVGDDAADSAKLQVTGAAGESWAWSATVRVISQ